LGSGDAGFLRRLRKGKNKVLKKNSDSVDWIFGGIGVIGDYSSIYFIAG